MAGLSKKCAFTSGESVGSGVASTDCRQRGGENVIIGCPFCNPAKLTWRCSCCYGRFASTIKGRLPELESHCGGSRRCEPAIDALLQVDWRALACDDGYEHQFMENPPGGLST